MLPLRKIILFVVILCALVAPAFSQNTTQRSSITVTAGSIDNRQTDNTLRLQVLALGRSYRVNLHRVKGYSAKITLRDGVPSSAPDVKPLLFQGDRTRRHYENRNTGAAASVIDGIFTLIFPDRTGNKLVSITAPASDLSLARVSITIIHSSCGARASGSNSNFSPAIVDQPLTNSAPIFTPTRYVEISTDADFEYCKYFKSSANAHIQAVLNSVEAIYTKQMGIAFDLVAQNIFCKQDSPYTSSNSDILLTQFRSYTNSHHHLGKADTYHLFSGKNLGKNIIGLSYVGAACASNGEYSYGLSQRVPAGLEPILTAHELGHILGANHDPSPSTIMSPYLSLNDTAFSFQSLGEMTSFVDQFGQCLTTDKALRLTLAVKAKVRKSGAKTSLNATLIPTNQNSDCNIYLFGSTKRSVLDKPDLFLTSAKVVGSQLAHTGDLSISASILNKHTKVSKKNTYLRGVITCPDGRWAQSEIGSFKGATNVAALAQIATY